MARMIARAIAWLLMLSMRPLLGTPPRIRGFTAATRQRIFVANHASHLDAVLLLSVLPAPVRLRTRPVAAEEYWSASPVRRYLIHSILHGVLVGRDRFRLNPLEPVAAALRQGDSLIFFPEGTRGTGGKLQPLKAGIFHLARWFPHIDLLPVWIDTSRRSRCSITFGAPLFLQEGSSQDEFLALLRDALEELRPR